MFNEKINIKMKENTGVTLVALVITIIVLITLSGITISALTGEGGLINQAITSKERVENIIREEEKELLKESSTFWPDSKVQDINYKESTASIANPDRGWYAYFEMNITSDATAINNSLTGVLQSQTDLNQSLIAFFVNLENTSGAINGSADREITQQELEKIDNALGIVRKHNKKVILRFRYVIDYTNAYKEPSMEMMLKHIEQVGPILEKNKDVINVVEAGFLGVSGEWTQNNYSDTESRRKIVYKLLDVLPKEIMVNVRTPSYYRAIFDKQNPINETTKFSDDYASRVGLHNDGYLGSISDLGTYNVNERDKELAWQDSHNKYTIFGGEASTDPDDPSAAQYSDGENAVKDMQMTHCSYLNRQHNLAVLNKWKNTTYDGNNEEYKGQTHYKYIEDHMGYRYVLREAVTSSVSNEDGMIKISLQIENTGFGNMVHEKNLELIIEQNGNYYKAKSNIDVRDWKSGTTSTVVLLYNPPKNIESGVWNAYIKISDKLNEDYCVQLANDDVWDEVLKANYVGKFQIESTYIASNSNGFAQVDSTPEEGSDTIHKIASDVVIDGEKGSKYEWSEGSCLHSKSENNTKFYVKNDKDNLYMLMEDDRIQTLPIYQIIMRVKTPNYVTYEFNVLGKAYDMTHMIENSAYYRVPSAGSWVTGVSSADFKAIKGKGIECRIPLNSIDGMANGVEIDNIGFNLYNASWVQTAGENLGTEYTYRVNL